MVTKQTEPDVDAWKASGAASAQPEPHQEVRRDRRRGGTRDRGRGTRIGMMGGDDAQPTGSAANPTIAPEGAEQQALSIVDVRSGTGTTLTVPSSASSSTSRSMGRWSRTSTSMRTATLRCS